MYPMTLVALGLLLWTWGASLNMQQEVALRNHGIAMATSTNFWVYRSSVVSYVVANPAASGVISDGVLSFPVGYARGASWANIIQGGVPYVYSATALSPEVADAIAEQGGRSLMIGRAMTGNVMSSLSGGATGIPIPSAIPVGAVVVAGR